jgi:hypothetical protein
MNSKLENVSLWGLGKTTLNPNHNQCPDQDSNRALVECKSEELPFEPNYSVLNMYRTIAKHPHGISVGEPREEDCGLVCDGC